MDKLILGDGLKEEATEAKNIVFCMPLNPVFQLAATIVQILVIIIVFPKLHQTMDQSLERNANCRNPLTCEQLNTGPKGGRYDETGSEPGCDESVTQRPT